MTITHEHRQGWGWPLNAKKAHYFIIEAGKTSAISLCGGWLFGGNLFDDKHDHPDNCKKCMEIREKQCL